MNSRRAAFLLLLLAAPALAQEEPASSAGEEKDATVIEVRDKIKSDPAIVDVVAERVARSQLAPLLTPSGDKDARIAAAKEWISKDPDAAARVMIGLMRDDSNGNTVYETSLLHQMGVTFDKNPGAEKNLYGRLRKNAKDSKLLTKQSQEMSDDEKREILRTLFEGKGSQSDKVIEQKDTGKSIDKSVPAATSFNGIYDRLGAGNLRGYSPQLMAMQSALNLRRPPGAPALVETGKLDYQTLAFPAYGMNYDVGNLDERLRRERIFDLARLAGATLTAHDWKDPDLEARLLKSVPADKLPARLKTRAELAAKARAAMEKFLAAAEKAKDPNNISRGLLMELGSLQKETARWIAAAALEEELSRTDDLDGFLTPELLANIDAVPAAQTSRDAYKRRGQGLKDRVEKVKSNAQTALDALQSDGWASKLGQVDKLVAENHDLKNNLTRDVEDFSRTPWRIGESLVAQPHWRDMLDDMAVKWAPSLSYSRGVALRRGRLSRLLGVFSMIAGGDANGAHNALINETGGH